MAEDFPIELPPGVFRSGTVDQSGGRFYDMDQMRWGPTGALQPTGGWAAVSTTTVEGKARAMHIWTDNAGLAFTVIGTHTGLYAMDRPGVLYDISPAGLTAGRADATSQGGYGNGLYGKGLYGTPRPASLDVHDVTVWTLENYGEDLVAVNADDGTVYGWDRDYGNEAAAISGAPTGRTLVATAERILMIGGADGNPRALAWSGQENITDWTPTTTNYAGDFILQTSGKIMAMRRVRGGVLILTSADAWLANFVGQPLVYGFEQKGGAGTGIIAQGAVAVMDGEAVPASAAWMGPQGFFAYNGYVQSLDCEVAGLVFSNINRSQISKVTAFHNADFGEVWWYYPSASSTEIDSYVFWDYRKNVWGIGHTGVRLCGSERGPLTNPLAVDVSGQVYKHEYGLDHGGNEPWAETGPFKIGEGKRVVQVLKIYPDERTLGDVDMTFYLRFRPMGEESTYGPVSLSAESDIRFTAREFRARFTAARLAPFRVGHFILKGAMGGER